MPGGCGNGRVDWMGDVPEDPVLDRREACDDGNLASGDGCASDCSSNETCGNGVVDLIRKEGCDDGNFLEHDGCSSTCRTETPRWIEHTLSPGRRTQAMSAYDSRRDRVVVFGGVTNQVLITILTNETLEWNGASWERVRPAGGPPARYGGAMIYDPIRARTLLFGGQVLGTYLQDLWEWDGTEWISLDAVGPSVRSEHAMVYDPRRKRVVLFGGNAGGEPLSDTWEWDGVTWTRASPLVTPPARSGAAVTYDPVRGAVVMTGGSGIADAPLQDTWEYDGEWRQRATMGPATGFRMAWDARIQRIIAFGGTGATAVTWSWDGSAWSLLTPTVSPPPRRAPVVVGTRAGILMFGGGNGNAIVSDTWQFETTTWRQRIDPPARSSAGISEDVLRARVIMFGGNDFSADTWERTTNAGWTKLAATGPSGRSAPAMTFDPARRQTVLFGGQESSMAISGQTWTFDGTTWTQRTPVSSPPPRYGATMVFDGRSQTSVMVGGYAANVTFDDVWAWDGTTWTDVTGSAPRPPAFGSVAFGYDPIRRQLLLFASSGGPVNTWMYDGTWHDLTTSQGPSLRFGARLSWNPPRARLLLTGGEVDNWEWDGTRWRIVVATEPAVRRSHVAFASPRGAGVMVFGGFLLGDTWELRWEGAGATEQCAAVDSDGDALISCDDPDCWPVCTPLCPPGVSCTSASPTCGDGTCDAPRESCRTCGVDCGACVPVCGDYACDAGESNCPGDCS